MDYKKLKKVLDPILNEVVKTKKYLLDELKIPMFMVEDTEFDQLCDRIKSVIDDKMDFSGDSRLQSLQYSVMASKVMLSLPLSLTLSRKIKNSIQSDFGYIYGNFLGKKKTKKKSSYKSKQITLSKDKRNTNPYARCPICNSIIFKGSLKCWICNKGVENLVTITLQSNGQASTEKSAYDLEVDKIGFDITECWFSKGEKADLNESILIEVHKITDVNATTVEWRERSIMVPRSQKSAMVHKGKSVPDRGKPAQFAEIEEINSFCKKFAKKIHMYVNEKLTQENKNLKVSLDAFNKTIALKEEENQNLVDDINSKYDAQIKKIKEKSDSACKDAENELAPELDHAKKMFKEALGYNKGLSGITRLELPSTVISTALYTGCSIAFTLANTVPAFGQPILSYITGTAHSVDPLIITSALVLTGGIVTGFLSGGMVRGFRIYRAARPLKKINRKLNKQKRLIQKKSDDKSIQLQKKAENESKNAKQRLKKIQEQREKIQEESERKISDLKIDADDEIKTIEKAAKKKVKHCKKKFAGYGKTRTEHEKFKFPPYKKAISEGFVNGKKPSKSTIDQLTTDKFENFKNSLSEDELYKLSNILNSVGNREGNDFINLLISMSPRERRSKLMSI